MNSMFAVLFDAAVKGSLILLSALLLCRFGKRMPSGRKHLLLFVSMLSLAFLPAVNVASQALNIPAIHTLIEPVSMKELILNRPTQFPASEGIPISPGDYMLHASSIQHMGFPIRIAGALWALGTMIMIVRMIVGAVSIKRLLSGSFALSGTSDKALLSQLAQSLGIRRTIGFARMNANISPLTTGMFKPAVMVPPDFENWTNDRRKIVLLHELHHVRRMDNLVLMTVRVLAAVYWFNPLAWAVVRRLEVEQENACDDSVLKSGIKSWEYAGHLLEVLRSCLPVRFAASAASSMGNPSKAERRITAILNSKISHHVPKAGSVFIISLSVFLMAIPMLFVNIVRVNGNEKADLLKVTYDRSGHYTVTNGASITFDGLARDDVPLGPPVRQADIPIITAFGGTNDRIKIRIEAEYTPVVATAEGEILYGGSAPCYGLYVVIGHANGLFSIYGNLNEISVNIGQKVRRGQEIGCTGKNTFIYYELRIGDIPTDPAPFLKPIPVHKG